MPRRLALLVATYRYQDAGLRQLTAPGFDAEALAAVLRDPEIAGYDVTILVNEPHRIVCDAIGDFYFNRRGDDLTLLYFTGHGLKDDYGRLYLAMTDTKRDRLLFTGVSAEQIDEAIESCSSRQKVLILDCCYSGAFPAGRLAKADSQVNSLERFQGKGRVVLTASDATQYSFEGNQIVGQGTQSVFTRFLVEGLLTGKADLDSDGDISLDELYSYVFDRVVEEMPQQRPKKQENVEGRIVIARNVHWRLPAYVQSAINSPFAQERAAVLGRLAHLWRIGNDLVKAEVINQILPLTYDDSKMVCDAAMNLITELAPERIPRAAKHARRESHWEKTVTVGPPPNEATEALEGQAHFPEIPSPPIDPTAANASEDNAPNRLNTPHNYRKSPLSALKFTSAAWISFLCVAVLFNVLLWAGGLDETIHHHGSLSGNISGLVFFFLTFIGLVWLLRWQFKKLTKRSPECEEESPSGSKSVDISETHPARPTEHHTAPWFSALPAIRGDRALPAWNGVIVLGIVLLLVGWLTGVGILWTLGILMVLSGIAVVAVRSIRRKLDNRASGERQTSNSS